MLRYFEFLSIIVQVVLSATDGGGLSVVHAEVGTGVQRGLGQVARAGVQSGPEAGEVKRCVEVL